MAERSTPTADAIAQGLLLAGILCLPLMKPPIAYPLVLPDVIFVLLLTLVAVQVLAKQRRLEWRTEYAVLLLYLLAFIPSLLASPDLAQSAFKLATTAYLVALALVTAQFIDDEAGLRRALTAWLVATAALSVLALAGLAAFAISPANPLYAYANFHSGTLPPGNYPRLSLTFLNANMACNYLTVSLGLLFAAYARGWITPRRFRVLIAGTTVAALATISAGLGGIALALGCGFYLTRRSASPAALWVGVAIAVAFVGALALTPIPHPTASFAFSVPGTNLTLFSSGRFLIWSGAAAEFVRSPIIGHGIGIEMPEVLFADPTGILQRQTDAHNVFLSIAVQAGLVGLAGLTLLIGYVARLIRRGRDIVVILLGLTLFNAFLYQGLGGAFEDTRHLWVLLGLLIAASRIEFSRPDENSHRSGAPSRC